jgi:hypothetical protein
LLTGALGLWRSSSPPYQLQVICSQCQFARKRLIKKGFHTAAHARNSAKKDGVNPDPTIFEGLGVPDQRRQSSTNKTVFALVQKFCVAAKAPNR